jgi:hypothetical protein
LIAAAGIAVGLVLADLGAHLDDCLYRGVVGRSCLLDVEELGGKSIAISTKKGESSLGQDERLDALQL